MSYEMYTTAGDKIVGREVGKLVKAGLAGEFDRTELPQRVAKMIRQIATKFPEVRDTEPPWAITDEINSRLTSVKMWLPLSPEDF